MHSLKPNLPLLTSLIESHPESNLFPVVAELTADLETPVSAFLKVRRPKQSFLLESVEGGERIARYSYIGTAPYKILRQNGVDPLVEVQKCLDGIKPFRSRNLPDLSGGAFGYVSFDCIQYFEPVVKVPEVDSLSIPESVFLMCKSLVIFDHVKHTLLVVSHCSFENGDRSSLRIQEEYKNARERIETLLEQLRGPIPLDTAKADNTNQNESAQLTSNTGKEGYESFVCTLKDNIVQGNLIQAVPSHRMSRSIRSNAFDVYRKLRVINPSPYMFFFDLEDFEIVGASPEMLVKYDVRDRRLFTHPIAGTRRRGRDENEDNALAEELLQDIKERSEHVMLVDLGRNDIGSVAEPGSVQVESFMQVERYSHVMHIVSRVVGTLRSDQTAFDAFRRVFPAGTVSGAPKIRAMQIVCGLEKSRRGIYAGAVGSFGFDGSMNMCIAIRTMVIKGGIAHLQAGGGIVYDSQPEAEYFETIHKMEALAAAIDEAEESCADADKKRCIGHVEDLVSSYRTYMHDRCGTFQSPLDSYFGEFGGQFAPEILMHALDELEQIYVAAINDEEFHRELRELQIKYISRPTPLTFARRLTKHCGGARIWLKREDLCHTGAHKINNALGMALLARRSGKKRIVAETGAGQHGVATATACALLGLECVVYMGAEDTRRQALNVFRMKLLGATVRSVTSGAQTLKDAINEAMRDWTANVETTFYLLGSCVGPHPYPTIVRDFQRVIGDEARQQLLDEQGKLPDYVIACVGGGSNSIGMFTAFLEDTCVEIVGVEAAGCGVETGKHSATLSSGSVGVLHGSKSIMLQDENGQVRETHSISAGLDYPGVGPQHAHLLTSGRANYVAVTDKQALQGLQDLCRLEGIIPALESSHAIYHAMKVSSQMRSDQDVIICLSGRGDKDMERVSAELASTVKENGFSKQS